MNSNKLITEIKNKLELLKRKKYDKRSFQSGYLLGYAEGLKTCSSRNINVKGECS